MIRECQNHGYYADDHLCPACNAEGKFIMRTGERNSMARRLALILRHAPEKFELEMDINGWIDIKDIIFSYPPWFLRQDLSRQRSSLDLHKLVKDTDPSDNFF